MRPGPAPLVTPLQVRLAKASSAQLLAGAAFCRFLRYWSEISENGPRLTQSQRSHLAALREELRKAHDYWARMRQDAGLPEMDLDLPERPEVALRRPGTQ